ncbi:three-helix bundle dimerization domain-containing protein [Mycobacterium hubeiense]|uniref:three-helix bundle dimerization domain-containing protein n=1 Tax=Mycobacterium hubeiense TaxID=1867256 RepID=UPI000C7F6723|nr:hypothetical protein [Mycobacterium sp. QGD 101]
MAKKTEPELIAEVERRLVAKFTAVPPQRVAAAVEDAHARFEDSVIRDFVPLLVERRVASELARLRDGDRELASA